MRDTKDHSRPETAQAMTSDFVRLPGLFRRWEIEQVIDLGVDFHLEDAGTACDGTPLLAVYRRAPLAEENDGGTAP